MLRVRDLNTKYCATITTEMPGPGISVVIVAPMPLNKPPIPLLATTSLLLSIAPLKVPGCAWKRHLTSSGGHATKLRAAPGLLGYYVTSQYCSYIYRTNIMNISVCKQMIKFSHVIRLPSWTKQYTQHCCTMTTLPCNTIANASQTKYFITQG